jgi:hypothetical protein
MAAQRILRVVFGMVLLLPGAPARAMRVDLCRTFNVKVDGLTFAVQSAFEDALVQSLTDLGIEHQRKIVFEEALVQSYRERGLEPPQYPEAQVALEATLTSTFERREGVLALANLCVASTVKTSGNGTRRLSDEHLCIRPLKGRARHQWTGDEAAALAPDLAAKLAKQVGGFLVKARCPWAILGATPVANGGFGGGAVAPA